MPEDPLDPIEALKTIRTLASVAVEAEPEGGETHETQARRLAEHLSMILAVCGKALPPKAVRGRRAKPPPQTGEG